MRRRRNTGRILAGLLLTAVSTFAVPGRGTTQLRPLEPLAWEVFEPGHSAIATVGLGIHRDQRASLAGTEGRLTELGNFQATWRSGRIALEGSGTVFRLFEDERRFAPAFGGALDEHGPRRSDSGDYRILTTVLLTPLSRTRSAAVVRFGTRLPTTNNRVGLDRDQTDFFGVVGGRVERTRLVVTGETGVGIYGTRYPNFEQSDLWIYGLSAEYRMGRLTPAASLLGQMDLSAGRPLRANEDLTELRAGLRFGTRRWLQAQAVVGLAEFSPSTGLLLSAGTRR